MASPFSSAGPPDLHLHSTASDGSHPPEEMASVACAARLSPWALTDHDTLAGWRRVASAPGLVCGVEATASDEGREIHIVGLDIDPRHPGLDALLAANRALRLARIDALLARLPVGVGRGLTAAAVLPRGSDAVGRLHLARALTQVGGVGSVREAFDQHLADEHLTDASLPQFPPISTVVDEIRAAGGVAILAHPGAYRSLAAATRLSAGLDGVECAHPGLDSTLQAGLLELCRTRGLLVSAGSDTHRISSARRPGCVRLDPDLLAPLRQRLQRGV